MRFPIVMLILAGFATPLHAQEYRHNTWGMFAAPMFSELAGDVYNFEAGAYETSLGLGAFYGHVFTSRFSGRFEVSARQVRYETYADAGNPASLTLCSALESTIESVLAFSVDRHIDMAGHDARFSVGTGPVVATVYDQTIGKPSRVGEPPLAGTYARFGWMFDAGLALGLDPGLAVFARFRAQGDLSTFSESEDADIVRRLNMFGFNVGAEFGF